MLCVASFLVLLLLSAVSAQFRPLAKKAWSCASRRVTFRPCDTTFRDELKNTMLAPLAIRAPRWVKPASFLIEAVAWVMVISMITSVYILLRSGLNYAVYGSCNKHNPEACVVTAEVCGIASEQPTFTASLRSGDVVGAFRNEFTGLADTISTVPSRFRNWDGNDYLPEFASFRSGYSAERPTAVEVLDPGCGFCAQLFRNMTAAGFSQAHNVTYIPFPIIRDGHFQFTNSELITQYLTALRIIESGDAARESSPTDWAILEQIFAVNKDGSLVVDNSAGLSWQLWFNEIATPAEAEQQLQTWIAQAGYGPAQVSEIAELAHSAQTAQVMANNRDIVQNEIRTLTIPTLIAGGGLHRGSLSVEELQELQ